MDSLNWGDLSESSRVAQGTKEPHVSAPPTPELDVQDDVQFALVDSGSNWIVGPPEVVEMWYQQHQSNRNKGFDDDQRNRVEVHTTYYEVDCDIDLPPMRLTFGGVEYQVPSDQLVVNINSMLCYGVLAAADL